MSADEGLTACLFHLENDMSVVRCGFGIPF